MSPGVPLKETTGAVRGSFLRSLLSSKIGGLGSEVKRARTRWPRKPTRSSFLSDPLCTNPKKRFPQTRISLKEGNLISLSEIGTSKKIGSSFRSPFKTTRRVPLKPKQTKKQATHFGHPPGACGAGSVRRSWTGSLARENGSKIRSSSLSHIYLDLPLLHKLASRRDTPKKNTCCNE